MLNGLAGGSLQTKDGNIVQVSEGQKMANEFMGTQTWSDQFVQENNTRPSLTDEFLQQEKRWADQFSHYDEGEASWIQRWEQEQGDFKKWTSEYLDDSDWEDTMWSNYERLLNGYHFQENNPYMGDPEL